MRRDEVSGLRERVKDYLVYLEVTKNRSRATIANYRFYLERFCSLTKVTKPDAITPRVVQEYRLLLNRFTDERGRHLSKATQNYHLIALRSFLKFLAKEDTPSLAAEKVELPRLPERQVDFLEGPDLEALLAAPMNADNADILRKRDKAILEVLFSTGLRVSELVSLKRSQVSLKKDELTVRGKGAKLRLVFLSPEARSWIGEYEKLRMDNAPFLFVRHDRAGKQRITEEGKALSPRSVQRLLSRYAKLAGITKHVTPHTLRHSYATDLLMNGADVRSVQALLGHASITTTQIYTHITNRQLREVHQAFHARRRKER